MAKKRTPNSADFQEMWASYKIELLQNIVKEIKSLHQDSSLPEWQKEWFTVDEGNGNVYTIHRSWSEFFADRKDSIEAFSKSDRIGYSYFPYETILDDKAIYNVIEYDCLDLIKLIKNYSYEKHTTIFQLIEDYLHRLLSILDQIYGRQSLKWEQKQAKSGSGIGQKKAKEKRISTLVENLRQYVTKDGNEIRIYSQAFEKLIDQTFEGAEDYPRHFFTKRRYREEAESILGKKIVLEGKRGR